jgi:hypothetical protein
MSPSRHLTKLQITISIVLIAAASHAQSPTSNASLPPNNAPTTSSSPLAIPLPKPEDKFAIPASANIRWEETCVDKSLNLNGDFQTSKSFLGLADGQWSVGPAVSTQLLKYDLAKKQAGFNSSVGAGASFRFYRSIQIKDETGAVKDTVNISQIKRECRQSSFGGDRKSYLAAPILSITPTIYATKPTTSGDLSVQPALLIGFFEDILNVGVGFNLTGPPGEKGNMFLLLSIGTGFSF